MEVPQLVVVGRRLYLFWSVSGRHYEANWAERHGRYGGLHGYVARSLGGRFLPLNHNAVVLADEGPDDPRLYDVRLLVEGRLKNRFPAIGFMNLVDGEFAGCQSLPFEIQLVGDAAYVVRESG